MFQRDLDLERQWHKLLLEIEKVLGSKPKDLNGVLFIIGVQELGKGYRPFSKEEKQDLMHIAVCSLFRQSGYYELEGVDEEGWPHFRQLKALPVMGLIEQENFLKDHILLFFENSDLDERESDGHDEL